MRLTRSERRPRQALTRHGLVRFERDVYECPKCRHSHAPLDADLGLAAHDKMTLGVTKTVAYLAANASYPGASQHLKRLFNLAVSAAECSRVAQQWGARLDEAQRAREQAWTAPTTDVSRPAPPETIPNRVVLEADATSALTRSGEEHKMVYCGTAFALEDRAVKEGGRPLLLNRRYSGSGVDFEDFETRFRALGARLGMHEAEAVAFIADGAPCLWRMASDTLPAHTVFIQDFWHVSEHLSAAAAHAHGDGEAAKSAALRWRDLLKQSRLDELLRELRASGKGLRGKRKEGLAGEIRYLESGRARMDYARYLADGWPIGSGAIEGTCKHLVKERYNVTGARWRRDNIPAILALRLSLFNDEWDADWTEMRKAA